VYQDRFRRYPRHVRVSLTRLHQARERVLWFLRRCRSALAGPRQQ
jgi:hypothetical protein